MGARFTSRVVSPYEGEWVYVIERDGEPYSESSSRAADPENPPAAGEPFTEATARAAGLAEAERLNALNV